MPVHRRKPKPADAPPQIIPIEEACRFPEPTPEYLSKMEGTQKIDANDIMHRGGPGALTRWMDANMHTLQHTYHNPSPVIPFKKLRAWYPNLRAPVIDGLLRRGEIMNIIAASKARKSWLELGLAMNIISGGKWMDKFQCARGPVLIIDNELHEETIVDRGKRVSSAYNIPDAVVNRMLHFLPVRGNLVDFTALEAMLRAIRPGYYGLVILDAFYRFMPKGMDENDNGSMAGLYNLLDKYADMLDSALLLIHHTSKGVQANKSVTDVGAGAGAQSRACDNHVVFREHDEPNVVVFDAAPRSFPPVPPFCMKYTYPKWDLAADLDPTLLKGRSKDGAWKEASPQVKAEAMDAYEVLRLKITTPMTKKAIEELGGTLGIPLWSRRAFADTFTSWITTNRIKIVSRHNGPVAAKYICDTSEKSVDTIKETNLLLSNLDNGVKNSGHASTDMDQQFMDSSDLME